MKIRVLLLIFLFTFFAPFLLAAPATMRLDYYHTGNTRQETFSVDRVVIEPLPWPGDPAKNIDDSNLGNYLFEVRDRAGGQLLYSRGFNSIYGEWVTTDEAKNVNRSFSESLRFPAPSAPVRVVLKKREQGNFTEIWNTTIDPKDKFIDNSRPPSPGPLLTIQKMGEPASKADLLVLGDGYTVAERPKFEKDAQHFAEMLFAISPFREHRHDFNLWGLCPAAEQSGVSRPSSGIHRRNPLGTTYDSFDTERYVLTFDNRALRDIAAYAPYEFIEILVNSDTYGGGGIFNLYATVAIDNFWAPYVGVHEFGHHFAALADEYFTSQVAYLPATRRSEPWEPNVTALFDQTNLKWKDLLSPGTPIPTPWRKEEFERLEQEIQKRRKEIRAANLPESEMNRLLEEEERREETLLNGETYAEKIGAFEGANYQAQGYYRPQLNCIMFTRHKTFCAVCKRGIERIIGLYASQ